MLRRRCFRDPTALELESLYPHIGETNYDTESVMEIISSRPQFGSGDATIISTKRFLIFTTTIPAVAAAVYGFHYMILRNVVPFPGGEGGRWRMQQSYFIEDRAGFYYQQTPIMIALLLTIIAGMFFLRPDNNSETQKQHYWLQAIVGIFILSTPVMPVFGLFALTGIAAVSFIFACAIGWHWRNKWPIALVPFTISVASVLWCCLYFRELFVVYGD